MKATQRKIDALLSVVTADLEILANIAFEKINEFGRFDLELTMRSSASSVRVSEK